MDYYGQFPRRPTIHDIDQLDADYRAEYDFCGRALAIVGDESLMAELKLVKGDAYCSVQYDSTTDRFYLKHDNVLDQTIEFDDQGNPIEPEPAAYDAADAACDRYHYAKELQD